MAPATRPARLVQSFPKIGVAGMPRFAGSDVRLYTVALIMAARGRTHRAAPFLGTPDPDPT